MKDALGASPYELLNNDVIVFQKSALNVLQNKLVGEAVMSIIRPLLTEKNTKLQEQHQYVFEVTKNSNKIEIEREIEKRFNVKVKSIRTVIAKGKVITSMTRRGRFEGRRSDRKKAIVTLMEGYTIDLLGTA